MATLVKVIRTPKFKEGDRVQFSRMNTYDNYTPGYITVYGVATKINKISMRIFGVDGKEYIASIAEVKKYIDPFA